jgi:DNA repair protein RadC
MNRPRAGPTARVPRNQTTLAADILGAIVERAREILRTLGDSPVSRTHPSPISLARGPRRRVKLVRAAFELARLSIGTAPEVGRRIARTADVWSHMRARLSGLPVEEFWAVALDSRHRVLLDAILPAAA